jgi:hypothetical protein
MSLRRALFSCGGTVHELAKENLRIGGGWGLGAEGRGWVK